MNGPIDIAKFRLSEARPAEHRALRRVARTLTALWSRLRRVQQARRTRRSLHALDDQMLRDIGVARTAIEWVALHDAAREIVRTRALASCRLTHAAAATSETAHRPPRSTNPTPLTLPLSRKRERGLERAG